MAFSGRLHNLCKKSISHDISRNGNAPMMSRLNAIRDKSSSLFIKGLPWDVKDQTLRDFFTQYGEVVSARVIIDRERKTSRGYGFVDFASEKNATAAVFAMNGKALKGRIVEVSFANDKLDGVGGGRNGGVG